MKYGALLAAVAVLFATAGIIGGGWLYALFWPALSFATVALGYFHFGLSVYGKSSGGVLSPINLLFLFPFFLCLWSGWYALQFFKREPAFHQLIENVFIGRRLFSREILDSDFDHVIDLTCEFTEPRALRSTSYHSFQILDGFVASPERLRDWAAQVAELSGTIYIHCAEGHGRTGLFAAALLLHIGHSRTPDEALQFIKSKRPKVRLAQAQLATLKAIHEDPSEQSEQSDPTNEKIRPI